jgi:hypothetical protein
VVQFHRSLPLLFVLACGCEKPFLARDGTVIFPENGAHGAAVVTANGLEYHDTNDIPQPVVLRDANEPWRAPIGFILPQSGRFTRTSSPTILATQGLGIVLRPSDTRVPSWGGEVLVRIDVIAPAAEGTARFGENVAIVVDGAGEDTLHLVDVALGQLSSRDRVAIVDANGARTILPAVPATHRSMAVAAVEHRMGLPSRVHASENIAGALRLARTLFPGQGARRVLFLGDRPGQAAYAPELRAELTRFMRDGAIVNVVGTSVGSDFAALSAIGAIGTGATAADPDLAVRERAVRAAFPEAGLLTYRDVKLTFEGTPAPSHVLEATGGDVVWRLEAGELAIGDVHAGEARTEVVRVTVPSWVPGEPFTFRVTAHVHDVGLHIDRDFAAELPCTYDDDIERIADSRHGDVIAYASALATMKRLDAAFAGDGVIRAGGLRAIAEMHARSMELFARDMHDFAALEQAHFLQAILRTHE